MSYNSKYTGQQVEELLDQVANGGSGGEVQKTTEAEILAMGFTKNTGTYSKPSGGIPKTDLANAVQNSLANADNAFTGSILGFKGGDFSPVLEVSVNGENKTPNTSGKLDLGTFVNGVKANGTAVTVLSGEADIPAASTSVYGVTKLTSSTSSTSTALAATASAVKAAYDLANGKQDKLTSGTNIKTINGQSILGSGNITIEGGSGGSGGSLEKEVVLISDGLIEELEPNKIYIVESTTNVFEIQSFAVSGSNYEEYTVFFYAETVSGGTTPTIILPDDVYWANGVIPYIAEEGCYELSVVHTAGVNNEFFNAVLTPFNAV